MGKSHAPTVINISVEVNQCDCRRKHHKHFCLFGCVDDSSVMDDAHKYYSTHRPMQQLKVILPLTFNLSQPVLLIALPDGQRERQSTSSLLN